MIFNNSSLFMSMLNLNYYTFHGHENTHVNFYLFIHIHGGGG